jgi:pimeloyl-ACP methyl ester carboxylesterase
MTSVELKRVHVREHSIAYRCAGEGRPLVLLHGFLCDSRCWQTQLMDLADRFWVVAWNAPGAGLSSDPPDTFTTADYAHCLTEFLDAVSIEQAHILGLSWGGILAQEFYRLYPARILDLVLADTYAGWKGSLAEPVWKERLANCLLDASGPAEELVRKFLPGVFSDAAPQDLRNEMSIIVSEFHPVGFRLMSLSSAEMDTRDLLPTIAVPTLVLWGHDDRRSPMSVAEQLHKAIPGAELAVIPNAGHVSNMERPKEFNAHVRRFCLSHVSA